MITVSHRVSFLGIILLFLSLIAIIGSSTVSAFVQTPPTLCSRQHPPKLEPPLITTAPNAQRIFSQQDFSTPKQKKSTTRANLLLRQVAVPWEENYSPLSNNNVPASPNPFSTQDKITAAVQQQTRVGVLLLNLGGPEQSDDVEGFLYNLFADPDIIQLPAVLAPLQPAIAWFVSKRRAPKSRKAYESIGGGSPILKYSKLQADLIRAAVYDRHQLSVRTYIGMRYWYPFTEQALECIVRDKIEALVIVPLYPQFSISTSGSSLRVLQEEFGKNSNKYKDLVHTVVPSWYQREGYVQSMIELLMQQLNSFTKEELEAQKKANPNIKPKHVLFSAHGVPQSYIEAGDPYEYQMTQCIELISQRLPDDVQVHLSYQSRVGPIEWLRPYTDDKLPELGALGVKNLVVVPISFVSEHIETLEEIDIEYRELAEHCGITAWRRCPALNTHPRFVQDMADLIYEALLEPVYTVTEACVANCVRSVALQPLDERLGISSAGVQGVGGSDEMEPIKIEFTASSWLENINNVWNDQERWVARIAMLCVTLTILLELVKGQSILQLLFGRV